MTSTVKLNKDLYKIHLQLEGKSLLKNIYFLIKDNVNCHLAYQRDFSKVFLDFIEILIEPK